MKTQIELEVMSAHDILKYWSFEAISVSGIRKTAVPMHAAVTAVKVMAARQAYLEARAENFKAALRLADKIMQTQENFAMGMVVEYEALMDRLGLREEKA